MSRVTDACDDIVTAINAATLSKTITSVRSYKTPKLAHEDRKIDCWIYPRSKTIEAQTRKGAVELHVIDCVIRSPIDRTENDTTTEIDELLVLSDEIQDLIFKTTLSTQGQKVTGVVQEESLDFEALDLSHVFLTTITFTVRDQF